MRTQCLALLALAFVGCAATTPRAVFIEATQAFADGEVPRAVTHFSRRLQEARPVVELEDYYGDPNNRKGVTFFLRDHRFQLMRQTDTHATAKVTWTTGRSEPVYFVREDGRWKLDLPPEPVVPRQPLAPTPANDDP